jgi:hypothetical protein
MKVKDLIKQLNKFDQDAFVVVQEYNGCDDVSRVVTKIRQLTPQQASLNPSQSKIVKNSSIVQITAIKG